MITPAADIGGFCTSSAQGHQKVLRIEEAQPWRRGKGCGRIYTNIWGEGRTVVPSVSIQLVGEVADQEASSNKFCTYNLNESVESGTPHLA